MPLATSRPSTPEHQARRARQPAQPLRRGARPCNDHTFCSVFGQYRTPNRTPTDPPDVHSAVGLGRRIGKTRYAPNIHGTIVGTLEGDAQTFDFIPSAE